MNRPGRKAEDAEPGAGTPPSPPPPADGTPASEPPAERSPVRHVTRDRRVAVGIAGLGVLVAALDAYVVTTILLTIFNGIGLVANHPELAFLIVTPYLLGYVAAMPLLGQLSDRVGRRPVIYACLFGFAFGSLVSGVATNLPVLVVGRFIQGAAGGALLPVTFALVGDLWDPRTRPVALGAVGATQELGSVLGPLYGAGVAALVGWRGVFWINIPLAIAAALIIRRKVPGGKLTARDHRPRIDVVGGVLLFIALSCVIAGLFNPDATNSVLPPWGPVTIIVGVAVLGAFVVWEAGVLPPGLLARLRLSPTRLLDPGGVDTKPFLAAMGTNLLAGAALMITLVDVPLVAQTILDETALGGALFLSWFLIGLPIGALVGGFSTVRTSERLTATVGMALSTVAFWLIAGWPVAVLQARHHLGPISLPRSDVDLLLAGLGLGLVIAPVTSATLRASDPAQHGVASSAVVVGRMLGMLVGIAAAAAWGLHRYKQLTANLNVTLPTKIYNRRLKAALRVEYHEVFLISAAICLAAIFTALALGKRHASPFAAEAGETLPDGPPAPGG
jgi:MFS family permease